MNARKKWMQERNGCKNGEYTQRKKNKEEGQERRLKEKEVNARKKWMQEQGISELRGLSHGSGRRARLSAWDLEKEPGE